MSRAWLIASRRPARPVTDPSPSALGITNVACGSYSDRAASRSPELIASPINWLISSGVVAFGMRASSIVNHRTLSVSPEQCAEGATDGPPTLVRAPRGTPRFARRSCVRAARTSARDGPSSGPRSREGLVRVRGVRPARRANPDPHARAPESPTEGTRRPGGPRQTNAGSISSAGNSRRGLGPVGYVLPSPGVCSFAV